MISFPLLCTKCALSKSNAILLVTFSLLLQTLEMRSNDTMSTDIVAPITASIDLPFVDIIITGQAISATAMATDATCQGGTSNSNSDGRITIANFSTTDTYQYSTGTTFSNNIAIPATATTIPNDGIIANDLANANQSYTVRITSMAGLSVDRVVSLAETDCGCTYAVSNLNDAGFGSFRQAIIDANADRRCDIVIIDACAVTGRIDLLSALPQLTRAMKIQGPTSGDLNINRSSTAPNFRIIENRTSAEISHLTITGGNHASQAAGVFNRGTLQLNHCIITDNTSGQGAGLQNDGMLTANTCVIANNSSSIKSFGSKMEFYNCTIDDAIDVNNGTISGFNSIFNTIDGSRVRLEANSSYNIVSASGDLQGTGQNNIAIINFGLAHYLDRSNVAGADNEYRTADDGFNLIFDSFIPAGVNDGNNSNALPTDIIGNQRPYNGGVVERGAYEYSQAIPRPNITSQPQDFLLCEGEKARFTLSSTLQRSYQWQVGQNGSFSDVNDNTIYAGSTTQRLDVENTTGLLNSQYRCILNNESGSDTSHIAALLPAVLNTSVNTPLYWTGKISSDWHDACNWSPKTVPTDSNDVIIDSDQYKPTYYPIINREAYGQTLSIEHEDSLTILSSGSLYLTDTVKVSSAENSIEYVDIESHTLLNYGVLLSHGTISLSNDQGFTNIINQGYIENFEGASITIDSALFFYNDYTLINKGVFNYNAYQHDSILFAFNINNQGNIINTGDIIVSDCKIIDIINDGNLNNQGFIHSRESIRSSIIVDETNPELILFQASLVNLGVLNNSESGIIRLDKNNNYGLINLDSCSNAGLIDIGKTDMTLIDAILNIGQLNNKETGNININHFQSAGIRNANPFPFSIGFRSEPALINYGTISIDTTYADTSISLISAYPFTNEVCGELLIHSGDLHSDSSFVNLGYIYVEDSIIVTQDLVNDGLLSFGDSLGVIVNQTDSSLIVNRSSLPIFSYGGTYNGTVNGIYSDEMGSIPAGDFISPNTFTALTLSPRVHELYASISPNSGACNYIVPFQYQENCPDLIHVTNTDDNGCGSLRYAVQFAAAGDTITFSDAINGDTIKLTSGQIDIIENITIIGNGQDSTIIDATGNSRIFRIGDGPSVAISNMTLLNGLQASENGGAVYTEGELTLTNLKVWHCNARLGGAVFGDEYSQLKISESEFFYNSAMFDGGAILAYGDLYLTHSDMRGNSAKVGGALSYEHLNMNTHPSIVSNCVITGNQADNDGGGIFYFSETELIVSNSTIAFNRSGGAAGISMADQNLTLNNTVVAKNINNDIINYTSTPVRGNDNYVYDASGDHGITNGNGIDPEFLMDVTGISGISIDGDLQLMRCSPLVNGGSISLILSDSCDIDNDMNTLETVPHDIKGNPRTHGPSVDIGAYESQENPQTIYVDSSAVSGNKDGSNWTHAFTDLQSALDISCDGDQIWVAKGTYYPTDIPYDGNNSNSRLNTFALSKDVQLYGGFSAAETSIDQRNPAINKTILDANGGYHTIITADLSSDAILEGFVIQGSNGNGSFSNSYKDYNYWHSNAGGIFLQSSDIQIRNCIIQSNMAGAGAGVMIQLNSNPTISNCLLHNNRSGSAIYAFRGSDPKIINCTISNNSTGTFNRNDDALPQYINTIIYGNDINVRITENSTPSFKNCIVQGSGGSHNWNIAAAIDRGNNYNHSPAFVDADNGDYRLNPCSNGINTGDNSFIATDTLDLDNNKRIKEDTNGGIVDIGAYEYQETIRNLIYVDSSAISGNNTGESWTHAYTKLQDALSYATNCSRQIPIQIWVATGTYYPNEGRNNTDDNINAAFRMRNNLEIYGGFDGTETSLNQRSSKTKITILNGDINQDDVNDGRNTTTLIVNNGLDSTAVLDGFILTNAYRGVALGSYGGGIRNNNSNPTIRNCTFTQLTSGLGGAIFNNNSDPKVINCIFSKCTANRGTIIYNKGNSVPQFIGCLFIENSGAAAGIEIQENASCHLTNCTISGNNTRATIVHASSQTPIIKNTIIWNNKSGGSIGIDNASMIISANSTIDISHSLIQGWNPVGIGNLDGTEADNNPLFAISHDFSNNRVAADYRLQGCSPAINAGNSSINILTSDIDGNARVYDSGIIDMGAYEYQSPIPPTLGAIDDIYGPTTVCSVMGGSFYHINPVAHAESYEWSYSGDYEMVQGQGTHQLYLDIKSAGILSVIVHGTCDSSDPITIDITMGSSEICSLADCARTSTYVDDQLIDLTDIQEYRATSIIISDATLSTHNYYHYRAGQEITLYPGFEVEKGTVFEAEINPCGQN